jgi:hypothetical protein
MQIGLNAKVAVPSIRPDKEGDSRNQGFAIYLEYWVINSAVQASTHSVAPGEKSANGLRCSVSKLSTACYRRCGIRTTALYVICSTMQGSSRRVFLNSRQLMAPTQNTGGQASSGW